MTLLGRRRSAAGWLERLAWVLVTLVAVGLPAALFTLNMSYQRGALASIAAVRGDTVTQRISINPQFWRFEELRLLELLKRSVHPDDLGDRLAILDTDGQLVAENRPIADLAWPVLAQQVPLHDAGRVVAQLSVQRSIRTPLMHLAMLMAASIATGLLVLTYLRRLPLRALRQAEAELQHKAYHDALTGLYNRDAFRQLLGRAVVRAAQTPGQLAVLFIDLDRFKAINDTLGHDAGDEALCGVARQLRAGVRAGDVVARLSGDEFAVLIEGLADSHQAAAAADALLARFDAPFDLGGRPWHLSCSIGLSIFPQHAQDPDRLLAHADTAMLHAKSSGRSSQRVYSDEMQESVASRVHIEDDLRGALGRGEFRLHYQPLVDLASGRVEGAEALLRWQHPQRGLVPPVEFIPILEDLGLIHAVGEWVLNEACRQMGRWRATGSSVRSVSVNVSALQFGRGAGFVDQVRQVLRATALPPALLQLELTEGILMSDSERSVAVLDDLRRLGVSLAIDDFGTGYSSLSYLRRFPVSTLKVDRSFVRDMCTDPKDASIVRAVVQLAHSLGLTVVAEGIETPAQLAELRALGCDSGQGYLLGRPVAAAAFMVDAAVLTDASVAAALQPA